MVVSFMCHPGGPRRSDRGRGGDEEEHRLRCSAVVSKHAWLRGMTGNGLRVLLAYILDAEAGSSSAVPDVVVLNDDVEESRRMWRSAQGRGLV